MTISNIKQRFVTIGAFLAVCAVIGLLVMVSGIVPIQASSGHWALTQWILDFSKSRSVATHSLGIEVPSLDDPAMVLKGAGHYETGCVQCHGSPARPASPIALSMTATPPSLPQKIPHREPQELFFIVKHGIKFTGMPAWPAQNRDDEVWAMVAFLRELPSMNDDHYQELTSDSGNTPPQSPHIDVPHATLEMCHRCHGSDGLGRGKGVFPKLAGQSREYLRASLKAYAKGDRYSGFMQPVAATLGEQDLASLVEHFAGLPDGAASGPAERKQAAVARGRTIAHEGLPEQNVPSCVDCHGPADHARSPKYPLLAGQYADYLVLQLELFQRGERGGTASAHLMKPAVQGLTAEDMRNVAAYYASLPAE